MSRPPNTPNISQEKIQEIIELSKGSNGLCVIARKVGVSSETVYRYVKKG